MLKALTLLGCLASAMISFSAPAQPAFHAIDCSKSRDPARCEARQAARETCKEKRGLARKQCLDDQMPPPDCARARNPESCAANVAAKAACKGKYGTERRQCLRAQIRPAKK